MADRVRVQWDREAYPYLVGVSWTEEGPLVTVLSRWQPTGLVVAVDPRLRGTQVTPSSRPSLGRAGAGIPAPTCPTGGS